LGKNSLGGWLWQKNYATMLPKPLKINFSKIHFHNPLYLEWPGTADLLDGFGNNALAD
jgi:hypothetical protein